MCNIICDPYDVTRVNKSKNEDLTDRVIALSHDEDADELDSDSDSDSDYITYRDWWDTYDDDPDLRSVIADLRDGQKRSGYYIYGNRLYFRGSVVVPIKLVLEIIEHIHQFHHAGVEKTLELFKRRYTTSLRDHDVRRNVERIVRDCTVCGAANARTGRKRDRLTHHPIPAYIFSSLCMDFVDLPTVRFEKQTYDYALVVVDRLSGYVQAFPCLKDGLTGEKCASMFFRNMVCFTGLPKEIMTDADIRLASVFFNTVCQMSGVAQHTSTVYRPRSNGRAETAVRSVVSTLRKLLLQFRSKSNWVEILPLVLWCINSTPGVNIKYTPHQIVFGREAPGFGDDPPLHTPKSSPNAARWVAYMRGLREEIAEELGQIHRKEEERFAREHRPVLDFPVGSLVYVELRHDERPNKLGPRFLGPCKVIQRLHEDTYKVETPEGIKQFVFDRLKPYPALDRTKFRRTLLTYTKPRSDASQPKRRRGVLLVNSKS